MSISSDEATVSTTTNGTPLSADRLKHLEFIQAIVTRLGNNSFLLKSWVMTLTAATLALSAGRLSWQIALSGIVPLLGFWFLDSYFLRQERLFRALYEAARTPDSTVEMLSMNVGPYLSRVTLAKAAFSQTLVLFYGALLIAHFVVVLVVH
ncbi:hypothetical protein [Streptomyces lancefieldiae]|uniref:Uncharacterized protein n=1 Tax=Streptomyces lancefieldiae TaxID=3075520 RepID=A0ABU3AVZ6_9ACTN|nr:hypothetical protein [Streptomyces sp. DSM 40712]MDT0614374.1 hypothetical protein [Streptomyces sp. DSM 40712]